MAATFQADFASFNSKSTAPQPTKAPTAAPVVISSPENYKFDEQKLHKLDSVEKQELYVFQWLSNLEKELKKGDKVIIIKKYIYNFLLKQLLLNTRIL